MEETLQRTRRFIDILRKAIIRAWSISRHVAEQLSSQVGT